VDAVRSVSSPEAERRKARFDDLPEGPARLLAFPELWDLPESTGYVLWLDPDWRVVATARVEFGDGRMPHVSSPPGPFVTVRHHWFDTKLRRSETAVGLFRIPQGGRLHLYFAEYYR
jgi:hypothetical protein